MEILFENGIAIINCRYCEKEIILDEQDYEDGEEVDDICSLICIEKEKEQKKINKGFIKCNSCNKYKKTLNDITEYKPIFDNDCCKHENLTYCKKYINLNKPYMLYKLYKIQYHKWCDNCKSNTEYIDKINEKDNLQHIIKDDECIAIYVAYNHSEQVSLRNKISNAKCLITLSEN